MLLLTFTGTPISREAREACADVGRATSVHTLSTLRNVTVVCACLAVVYNIFNSCRLDAQKRNEKLIFFFMKFEACNKFIGSKEQLWKHTVENRKKGGKGRIFFCQDLSFHWCQIFIFYKKLIVLSSSKIFVHIEQIRKATTVTNPNLHGSFVYKKESWMRKCKASHKGTSHGS